MTKGGLTRPNGEWVPDGRARHLRAACEASLRALGVERIDLYQLHAPDPKTPFATSVRALAALQRDGLVEHIGLCNVTVGQIEEARLIADIAAVQVELSVWNDDHVLSGVAGYCIANGIRLLAYRPLGGTQRRRRTASDPVLKQIASRHGVEMDMLYCPHGGGPPICWCRKPLPGLGVVFIERYRLDPAQCLYVGRGPQDRGFARRLGFQYRDAAGFYSQAHP